MKITILVDGYAKQLSIKAAVMAHHGDRLFLAEPQHINYFTEVKFNTDNANHKRYIERGLMFHSEADAMLFVKSYLGRQTT